MKKYERWALWIALVVAVTAICVAILRTEPISIDWMGVLVAVLGILVATLIMWQIFTLIDIRKIQKEVSQKRDQSYFESELNLTATNLGLSDYFYYSLLGDKLDKREMEYKYAFYRVSSILHSSRIKDFKTCAVLAKTLKETIPPGSISLRASEKKSLLDLLSRVESAQSIEGFSDLLGVISRIEIRG